MLLAVDIGNTNIVFGLFDKSRLVKNLRLQTRRNAPSSYYENFFRKNKIDPEKIDSIIVSSVVPQTKKNFAKFCQQKLGLKPFDVSENIENLGIKIKIDNPHEVGADRVVNAIAFFKKYKKAGVIIDFGTATTFDVVDSKGNYLGGMISPGINLALAALSQAAARLPNIKIAKPKRAIGKSTVSAMQAGIYFGYLGLIEKSVAEIALELGKKPYTVATGGLAKFFASSKAIDAVEENLTIEGLYFINQQKVKTNRK